MTDTAWLGVVVLACAGVISVYRIASAWETVAQMRYASSSSVASQADEIPDDLVALAFQENEAWAQEELLRVIRERYETFRDWNKVRSAMNIGVIAS